MPTMNAANRARRTERRAPDVVHDVVEPGGDERGADADDDSRDGREAADADVVAVRPAPAYVRLPDVVREHGVEAADVGRHAGHERRHQAGDRDARARRWAAGRASAAGSRCCRRRSPSSAPSPFDRHQRDQAGDHGDDRDEQLRVHRARWRRRAPGAGSPARSCPVARRGAYPISMTFTRVAIFLWRSWTGGGSTGRRWRRQMLLEPGRHRAARRRRPAGRAAGAGSRIRRTSGCRCRVAGFAHDDLTTALERRDVVRADARSVAAHRVRPPVR